MTTTTSLPQGRARRIERARAIVASGGVRRWQGVHLVRSSDGGSYRVEEGRCECRDYELHAHIEGFACKHVLAVGVFEFSRQFGPVVIAAPAPVPGAAA